MPNILILLSFHIKKNYVKIDSKFSSAFITYSNFDISLEFVKIATKFGYQMFFFKTIFWLIKINPFLNFNCF